VQALAEKSITALALDVNRAEAAPLGSVVFGFLSGTARTVQTEHAQHPSSLPERGTNDSACNILAVRVGFEPTEPVKVQRFSRPPDSTALAPHRLRILPFPNNLDQLSLCRFLHRTGYCHYFVIAGVNSIGASGNRDRKVNGSATSLADMATNRELSESQANVGQPVSLSPGSVRSAKCAGEKRSVAHRLTCPCSAGAILGYRNAASAPYHQDYRAHHGE
jgi:hypothetical protein